jgi:hypothetical protein
VCSVLLSSTSWLGVGHLPRKQHREGVCDDQRDSPCEFFCVFSLLINVMRSLLLLAYLQITLKAIINCVEKLNKCFKTNLGAWKAINGYGLQLLLLRDLEHYHDKFLGEKDLQDEWKKAVTHPGKYDNLLVGQLDDNDLRAERD